MFTGSESASQKNAQKERFMSGDTNVMIMSLRSGAGLDDLQRRCSVVVIGELDWSPGVHQQIIWRLDREGQEQPVTVFFLVSEEGSDPPIMDVLGIKASEAHQIVDPLVPIRAVDDDTSNLRKLVDRYLKIGGKGRGAPAGAVEGAGASLPAKPATEQAPLFGEVMTA